MRKKLMALIAGVLLILGTLGCNGSADVTEPVPMEDNYRTYYEVFVYSFYDGNGDGVGDLAGLKEKLDYINDGNPETTDDLGCNGIWLMPIMPSPTYHKYDVTDYMAIDPEYGTMEDFEELMNDVYRQRNNNTEGY